jgi:ABC-type transport system involved in cytochrome bd biosynthesis fused ATPase/permease subunit
MTLARALATDAELVLAHDISSALDARRAGAVEGAPVQGRDVSGITSKRAALQQAGRVVVLNAGLGVASGPWSELAGRG